MWDLKDKIALITGATSGIGLVAAKEIAKTGVRMVLVVRDQPRGMAAWEQITKSSGNENVELMIADLSSMEEIRLLAHDFKKKYKNLHLLVNNAAVVMAERTETVEGFETQFAVNHLAYFLMTNLLLDMLRSNASARIVNTASGTHKRAELDLDDLQTKKKKYRPMEVYGRTKLLNVIFTTELARRLKGTNVTVNCHTPGFRATNLGRNMSPVMRFGMRLFAGKAEKGAETLTYLATSPDVEGVSGKYFSDKKAAEPSKVSQEKETGHRLWAISEKLVGLKKPQE